jgi:uncharacterized membrane protein YebE (DUF533 family)
VYGNLLGSLIGGALGARPKSHSMARQFFGGGLGSFLNASTLLSAAALGWGAYEVWRTRPGASTPTSTATVVPGTARPASAMSIPAVAGSSGAPGASGASSTVEVVQTDGLRRTVALVIAAARCDGELGEEEYAKLVATARESGADKLVAEELARQRPLPEILAGARDPKLKEDLYVLAFGIVRADEDVNAAERVFLARLSGLLGLDDATVARLEKETAQKIMRGG